MRLRFAVSGKAAKPEVKEPSLETTKEQGDEQSAGIRTKEAASATNDETKIKAETGN